MSHNFLVNGVGYQLSVPHNHTLADMLRDQLGLTGCKIGCDQGICGACTVLVQGVPVAACSSFAFSAEGKLIETIEGLSTFGRIDPVQQAFLETGAVQCGFCTAGLILSAHALLRRVPDPDDETISHWLQAHVCRCTGYTALLESVRLAARRLAQAPA